MRNGVLVDKTAHLQLLQACQFGAQRSDEHFHLCKLVWGERLGVRQAHGHRIDLHIAELQFVVQVRSRCQSRLANTADHFAVFDLCTLFDVRIYGGEVRV